MITEDVGARPTGPGNLEGVTLGGGRYRLEKRLDRQTGQGQVYRGTHLALRIPVAVKILPGTRAQDRTARTRFQREALRAAQLHHSNVVVIHDFGYEERLGIYYIVSEFVEGRDLQTLFAQHPGRAPVEQALPIVRQIGDALQYAHEQGIIHRDVKPGNILIETRTGRAVLCDFGLARMEEDEDLGVTTEHTISGTLPYMSPEQAMGLAMDRRTDIYSFGLVVYEMLTGTHPFRGQHDTSDTLRYKQVHEPPPSPRRLNPQLSRKVEAVLLKALAKAPDQRYQTASEFVAALEQAVKAPAGPSPVVWALAGAALVLIVAGAAWALQTSSRGNAALAPTAAAASVITEPAPSAAPLSPPTPTAAPPTSAPTTRPSDAPTSPPSATPIPTATATQKPTEAPTVTLAATATARPSPTVTPRPTDSPRPPTAAPLTATPRPPAGPAVVYEVEVENKSPWGKGMISIQNATGRQIGFDGSPANLEAIRALWRAGDRGGGAWKMLVKNQDFDCGTCGNYAGITYNIVYDSGQSVITLYMDVRKAFYNPSAVGELIREAITPGRTQMSAPKMVATGG